MAKANTEGFRWLPSYYEAVRDLPDAERLAIYDAIIDFGFGNKVHELSPLLNGYFMLIKPTLEKSIRFEIKQKENGCKGGRPPKPKENRDETQNDSGENLAIAVANDIDVANEVAVEEKTRSRFIPPTVEEVLAYCQERHNGIDPQAFVDFYEASGWKRNNTKIKDWRACVRTWERREKNSSRDIHSPDRYSYGEGESL